MSSPFGCAGLTAQGGASISTNWDPQRPILATVITITKIWELGGFNRAYIDLLEQTAAGLRQIRPDSFLMIENCGDVYSSRVWGGSLAWNGEDYDEFFNLYKYTFPEHTLINMVNPPRRMEDGELQEKPFIRIWPGPFCWAVCFGLKAMLLRIESPIPKGVAAC